jgi:methionyl-tRNA synthetase
MTLGQDSTYSYDSLVQRLNADLANDLGNLHSRVTKMASRYLGGRLPARAVAGGIADEGSLASLAEGLTAGEGGGRVARAWREWRIHAALAHVVELVSATNEYLERQSPWRKAKDPAALPEVAATLLHAAEAVRLSAALLSPVMPDVAGRILRSLGRPPVPGAEELVWGVLDGEEVVSGDPVYPRLEARTA